MKKRSLKISGHATSISLEPEFWKALENIAQEEKMSLSALIAKIDQRFSVSSSRNLASQLRVFVINKLMHEKYTDSLRQ